LRRAPAKS